MADNYPIRLPRQQSWTIFHFRHFDRFSIYQHLKAIATPALTNIQHFQIIFTITLFLFLFLNFYFPRAIFLKKYRNTREMGNPARPKGVSGCSTHGWMTLMSGHYNSLDKTDTLPLFRCTSWGNPSSTLSSSKVPCKRPHAT